jgi:hypothetical protein
MPSVDLVDAEEPREPCQAFTGDSSKLHAPQEGGIMTTFEFTLLVEGGDLQTDESQDALFEAGCDDATIGLTAGVQYLQFDREARSLADALVSAITAVEKAVPGIRVVRVAPDEYVTLAEIARRIRRTRESVRLLATGERGPGDFPPPAARAEQRNKLWRWAEVASWLTDKLAVTVPAVPDAALSAVNGLLQARAALARLDAVDRDAVLALQPAVRSQLLELAAAIGAAEVKRGGFDAAA